MSDISEQTAETWACEVIRSFTGSQPLSIHRITKGVMTTKFEVRVPSDRFIIRFYPRSRAHLIDYEPDLLRRCHTVGMNVPMVLIDSRRGPSSPLPYVIYRMIDGESLSDRLAARQPVEFTGIAAKLADNLKLLASIPVEGFGDLRESGMAKYESWHEFAGATADKGFPALRAMCITEDAKLQSVERVFRGLTDKSPATRPVLVWGDVSLSNIIVDDHGAFAGLIDFEGTLAAADAVLTLGYFHCIVDDHVLLRETMISWTKIFPHLDIRTLHFYCVLRGLRLAKHWKVPLPASNEDRLPLPSIFPGFLPSIDYLLQHYH